jgi:hypothetical protein
MIPARAISNEIGVLDLDFFFSSRIPGDGAPVLKHVRVRYLSRIVLYRVHLLADIVNVRICTV